MLNPAIPWENAIRTRRSVRHYHLNPLSDPDRESIQAFIDNLKVPFEHQIQCRLFKAEPTKKLYFSMNAPPDNLALIAPTDVLSISKVGFLGELIILFATTLGISTCWYGHYHLETLEHFMPHLPDKECLKTSNRGFGYSRGEEVPGVRAICVTPLGYHDTSGLRLVDRITENFISYKRKPLAELLEAPVPPDALSETLSFALDLARLAPSAANSQHWRFHISEDQSSVTVAMPPGYKHLKWEHPNVDIGICAAHLWIGLLLSGHTPKVQLYLEEGRAHWRFDLV